MSADFGDEGSRLEEVDRSVCLARLAAAAAGNPIPLARAPIESRDCIECGERIPPLRLQLNPNTRRCTPCASDIERPRRLR